MSFDDKKKWDEKYNQKPQLLKPRPHSIKLEKMLDRIKGNKALDVACGSGRNTIFLANKGFLVDAVDIARKPLEIINQQNNPNIKTILADLDNFNLENNLYDLIVMCNFLDRSLVEKLKASLALNGVFFIETYMKHPKNEKPDSNPDFLLGKDELKTFFISGYEVLDYEEFENETFETYRMQKQYICVRKK